MTFKGKKGMVAILILSIFFFVIMGTLFIKLHSKKSQFNATLGETQLELIEKYTEGEKVLFYIDQSSKYSIYESVYDLSLNGGFFDYKCGNYKGYGLWQSEKGTIEYCSPDYKKNFGKFISNRLDSYLTKKVFDLNLPTDNYDFVFEENEKMKIHGIATIPFSINILCGKDKTECGVYKIKPSFSHEINYNFNDYEIIKERLNKILEECKKEQDLIGDERLKECVYGKMGTYKELEWKTLPKDTPIKGQEEDRNFAFEATSNKKIPLNDNNIIYKFAIFVLDEAAPPAIDSLEVSKKEGENKVILKWKESEALDVKEYIIYYVSSEEKYNIKCEEMFDYFKTSLPVYNTAKKQVELFELSEYEGILSYDLEIEENRIYCFAVTAVDEVPNEISQSDEKISKINYPKS